jgi:hypothetical protein
MEMAKSKMLDDGPSCLCVYTKQRHAQLSLNVCKIRDVREWRLIPVETFNILPHWAGPLSRGDADDDDAAAHRVSQTDRESAADSIESFSVFLLLLQVLLPSY